MKITFKEMNKILRERGIENSYRNDKFRKIKISVELRIETK